MEYYYMSGSSSDRYAVAEVAPEIDELDIWDLVEELQDSSEWKELNYRFSDGLISDLPPTDLLGRICSRRLKDLLAPYTKECLWLPVRIWENKKEHEYFFLLFPNLPDVLDVDKSEYQANRLFKAHISLEKTQELQVFCFNKLGVAMVVSSEVKKAVESSGFAGIEFEKIPAS